MNVLFVSYDYPPYKGGIATVSYEVARQLDRLGEKVIVVAQKAKNDRGFDKKNSFKTYRCINIFFLRELALIILLPYLVRRYRINIIYLLIWCQGGIAAFLTNKILKIPYILHAHGLEFVDCKRTFLDRIKYSLFRDSYKRAIFKSAKRIMTVSNYTKGILLKEGIEEDGIEVVYNGVDIDRFKPGPKANPLLLRHNLNGKKVLMTVSRLNEYKGHEIVINLMPRLLKRIPNLAYLIVGSGRDKGLLEAQVGRLKLEEDVIFTGHADEHDLPLYYNTCDVFIMLTRERLDRAEFEGYGLAFLEANSSAKPVIGAKTGGIPDAVSDGKTGYLVDPENEGEIMGKIVLLLENKELAERLGQEGRRRIMEEGLTWEAVGRKIQGILSEEARGAKAC